MCTLCLQNFESAEKLSDHKRTDEKHLEKLENKEIAPSHSSAKRAIINSDLPVPQNAQKVRWTQNYKKL
jgi:hypothetical protein